MRLKFQAVIQPGCCETRYYPETDNAKFMAGERAYFVDHEIEELESYIGENDRIDIEYVSSMEWPLIVGGR